MPSQLPLLATIYQTLVIVDPFIQVYLLLVVFVHVVWDLSECLPSAQCVINATIAVDDVNHVGKGSRNPRNCQNYDDVIRMVPNCIRVGH